MIKKELKIRSSKRQGMALLAVLFIVMVITVISIGFSAFETGYFGNAGNFMTQVTLGNSVKSIGSSAFKGHNLTEVVIPDSVTSIGDSAFRPTQSPPHDGLTSVDIGNPVYISHKCNTGYLGVVAKVRIMPGR